MENTVNNSIVEWILDSDVMTNDDPKTLLKDDILSGKIINTDEIQNGRTYILFCREFDQMQIIRKIEDRGENLFLYVLNPERFDDNLMIPKSQMRNLFDKIIQVESYGRYM